VVLNDKAMSPSDLVAVIDDVEVPYSISSSAHAADKFWFVPEEQRFDVRFTSTLKPGVPQFSVSVGPRVGVHGTGQRFLQYKQWKEIQPTPPLGNIERVSGKGATDYNYHNNGATDHMRFSAVAAQHRLDLKTASVLDWGCGCGRLTRYFLRDGTNVSGIDIDPDNIAWCVQNLHSTAFTVTDLLPPTSFKDQSFDLVIANSVLSHLTLNAMEQWLQEVHRLLKPGGLALLSYHGNFSLAGFCSKTEDFVKKVIQTGFNADLKAQEVNDMISDPEYYRHTFMTDAFAAELFSTYFDLEEVVVGFVSRFQNLAVLRRR
jgi:SAM-dependent methyltransferase